MATPPTPPTPQTPPSSVRRLGAATPSWLQPDSNVEVRIDEDGFRGAWYSATVRRRLSCTRAEVAYKNLMSDADPELPLVEPVRFADLRPCGGCGGGDGEFELFELVEAFHNDGWWSGVVCAVVGEGEYRVAFPTSREEIEIGRGMLRPMFRWQCDGDDEEAEDSGFIVGADVEVSRDRANFGKTWFPAQVKKVISNTVFLVEYQNVKRDGHDSELLTEIVDVQNIRPLWVPDLSVDFTVKDKVEVYLEAGWSPGFVTKILELSQYIVKLDHHDKEMEFNKSAMRPRSQWNGSDWVLSRKRKAKEPSSVKRSAERRQTSSGNLNLINDSERISKSDSGLAKQRKTNEHSPGDQIESAKSSSGLKEKILESNGKSLDNFVDRGSTECNDQTIKSFLTSKRLTKIKALEKEKKPDDILFLDGVSKELLNDDQDQVIDMIPELPLQGEVHLVIDAEKSINFSKTPKMDILLNQEDSDFVRLAELRNSLVGQNTGWNSKKNRKKLLVRRPKTKAHTEVGSGFSELSIDGVTPVQSSTANPQDNMMSDFSNPIEASLEKDGNLVNEEVASREILIRCDRSLIHKSSTLSPSKNIQPPFVKNSALWQAVESMEIFKKVPQLPHFQPLEKYANEFREGMAIGLMISFVNLVSSVQQLQVVDPAATIEEKFELLVCLEENGFNIQFLHSQLEKLLELQACERQFKSKKSLLNATVSKKKEDNVRIDALVTNVNNTISELEQKLRQAQDEKSSLYVQRQKNESEISIMQKDVCDAEKAYNSAANSLTAALSALW